MELKIKSKFISTETVKSGDLLTIKDEGEIKPRAWKGQKREVLEVKVDFNGEEKICSFNITSQKNLIKEWGSETKNWVGKKVKCYITSMLSGGEVKDILILTPDNWTSIKGKNDDIPVIDEGTYELPPDEIDAKDIPF